MKPALLHVLGKDISAEEWDNFIAQSPQNVICATYSYISVISPNWEAWIVAENGIWQAVFPFCQTEKWKIKRIAQPLLTQYWGIFFRERSGDAITNYRHRMRIATLIAENLPHLPYSQYRFAPDADYLLPFYWQKFCLSIRYTYRIDLPNYSPRFQHENIKQKIRKAHKSELQFLASDNVDLLFDLIKKQAEVGKNIVGIKHPQPVLEKLRTLLEMLQHEQKGKLYIVQNKEGTVCSAGFFSFYGQQVIYHCGTFHPQYPDVGAMAFLLGKTILLAQSQNYRIFDFEGSMLAGVEKFFRDFGSLPVSYSSIYRSKFPFSLLWNTL